MDKWAEEKNWTLAREQRGIYFIVDGDPNCEESVHNARRKLDIRRASVMSCKVTTPTDPNGSSWERPCASEWSKMETQRLQREHEDIIIESPRIPTKESTEKTREDLIADRGHVCTLHYNKVHKPIPIPKATKSPVASFAMDKDWDKCENEAITFFFFEKICMFVDAKLPLSGRAKKNLLRQF